MRQISLRMTAVSWCELQTQESRGRLFFSRSESGQDARLGPEHVVTIEAELVQHGGIRSVAEERLVPVEEVPDVSTAGDGNASERALIGFSADLDRSVFDHDVGPGERGGELEIEPERQAEDRSTLRVNGNLDVIPRIPLVCLRPVPIRDTADPHVAERQILGNGGTEHGGAAGGRFFPADPGQLAIFLDRIEYILEGGTEHTKGEQLRIPEPR